MSKGTIPAGVVSGAGIRRWSRIDEGILYMSKTLKREGEADDGA